MLFNRIFPLREIVFGDSDFQGFLMLGPRQTGKSSLLRKIFGHEALSINLLETDVFMEFNARPQVLREILLAKKQRPSIVIIDEIQKIPALLDEIHLLIEEHGFRFLLTGSSARKLRRHGTNLLGGRLRRLEFFPLVWPEIGAEKFDLSRVLSYGTLPRVYLAKNPSRVLKTYCGTYLKEEIAAEGLVRNLPAFGRFIEIAALSNGQMLQYTNISNDAGVPKSTVIEYYKILMDTMITRELRAFKSTIKRKPIESSKLYFFDVGVARSLCGKANAVNSEMRDVGVEFETYIYHELMAWISYNEIDCPLTYWRSNTGFEVDFLIGEHIAIEVKTTRKVSPKDLSGLKALSDEGIFKEYILVCCETRERLVNGIRIMPWQDFLARLWANGFNINN